MESILMILNFNIQVEKSSEKIYKVKLLKKEHEVQTQS